MQISEEEVGAAVADTAEFLKRLFTQPDHLAQNARNAEEDLLSLAQAVIRDHLAIGKLSPDFLADRLGISRASLYRVFAPHGGIMRYVQERRLIAVRAALSDPLETRKLSRIAADLGFNSEAHFSRAFRQRFGITASDYRRTQLEASLHTQLTSPEVVNQWWVDVATRRDRQVPSGGQRAHWKQHEAQDFARTARHRPNRKIAPPSTKVGTNSCKASQSRHFKEKPVHPVGLMPHAKALSRYQPAR